MIKKLILSKRRIENQEYSNYVCFGNSNYALIKDVDDLSQMCEARVVNMSDVQNIFLYSSKSDANFWKRVNRAAFIFLTFIRVDYENLKKMKHKKNLIEDREDFFLYNSFDGYDFVLASYSENDFSIEKNIMILNDLDIKVIEANTMVMVFEDFMKVNKISNVKIDRVSFRFRLKDQEYFKDIEKSLLLADNKAYYIRNGNYDIEWFFDNLEVTKLFSFFGQLEDDNKGLRVNGPFQIDEQKNLYKAIEEYEIRLYKKEILAEIFKSETRNPYFEDKYELDEIRNKIVKYVDETDDLMKVISFLDNSTKNSYYNDSLLITYSPIKLYLDKIKALDNHQNYYEFSKSFTLFTDSLINIMEIFNNSRLHSTRGLSFQGDRITIPIKLLVFYSSFIFRIKELLLKLDDNDYKCKYSFLLIPTKRDNVKLDLILKGDKRFERLLLVSAPLNAFYKPSDMLIQLSHEVSHYACHILRQRKKRVNYLVSAFADYIYNVLFSEIEKDELSLSIFLKHFQNSVNEVIEKSYSKQIFYSDVLSHLLNDIVIQFSKDLPAFLIEWNENKVVKYQDLEGDEYFSKIRFMKSEIEGIKKNFSIFNQKGAIRTMINRLIIVTNECFSDLIAIYVLNIEFRDYLNNIMQIYHKQEKEGMVSQFITLRIAFIKMLTEFDEDIEYEEDSQEINTWKQVIDICSFVEKAGEKEGTISLLDNPVEGLFEFPSTCCYIFDYLKDCKSLLNDRINKNSKEVKEIRNIYNCLKVKEEDLENIDGNHLDCLFDSIDWFKKQIYNNIKGIKEENSPV